MKRITYIGFILVVLSLIGCKKTIPVKNYMSLPVASQYAPQTATKESVEKAILRAAIFLGWKVEKKKTGMILATLDIRKHQLVVLITHDDKTFSIEYKDSVNLGYDGSEIHRQYAHWVKNLINSINAFNVAG